MSALEDRSEQGVRVIEIGPGAGALTRVMHKKYPRMTAIEIDQRAIRFLKEKIPELSCIHTDVLAVDWHALASERGGKLNILGNLPYYITSQVLFSLADHHSAIDTAVVTMQLEVKYVQVLNTLFPYINCSGSRENHRFTEDEGLRDTECRLSALWSAANGIQNTSERILSPAKSRLCTTDY